MKWIQWAALGIIVLVLIVRFYLSMKKTPNSDSQKDEETSPVEKKSEDAETEDDEEKSRSTDEEVAEIILSTISGIVTKPKRILQRWGRDFYSKTIREKFKIATRFTLQVMALLIALYLTFPQLFAKWVYQGLILNCFQILPVATAFVGFAIARWQYKGGKKSAAVVTGMAVVLAVWGLFLVVHAGDDWRTAMRYKFLAKETLPDVDQNGVRFTPFDVAYNDMIQKFGSAEFSISRNRMHAVDIDGSVGFVAPVTPEGVVGTFFWKQDGFMVFSDQPGLQPTNRVKRVKQPFASGEGMLILDDIWRSLYLRDPFCFYPEIYYLQVGAEEFVAVAPKIRYAYEFPCYWVPYWAGTTIVDSSGKVDSLTREEAIADPRFKGKRLFPQSLARTIVESQKFDEGFFSGFYQRPGLIRIPVLPGGQQMPYLYRTHDGKDLYVIATEPAGNSSALFRLYMIDAHNGALSVWELDPAKGILGPDRAGERVKSISGYTWGYTHDLLESFPLPHQGILYWKYTVSVISGTGITFTAVVNTTNGEIEIFHSREDFDDWLAGRARKKPQGFTPEMEKEMQDIRALLQGALKKIEKISF